MRKTRVGWAAFVVISLPTVGRAQVYRVATPPPLVTAANAPWQLSGRPLFYAGSYYYAAGASIHFDGNVMSRTGTIDGVPIYQNVTLEPFSIIYVPIGGGIMRPYERLRQGELAGTVGSRTPSFPIERDIGLSVLFGRPGLHTPALASGDRLTLADRREPARGDQLVQVPARMLDALIEAAEARDAGPSAAQTSSASTGSAATGVETVRRPQGTSGIWIDFDGARWFAEGAAVTYDAQRFEPAGSHRGFPVYRERAAQGSRIFVTVVPDGPLAPFVRR